ncbi:MAG: tetraacyldisaccharide 4'-kinase [Rhizobiaceae bacterium]
MALQESPPFWWRKAGVRAWALSPLAALWGAVAARRMEQKPSASVQVPVLCVGNFVAGGAGKTPTVLALGKAARKRGLTPGFLSRGYGGHLHGPVMVDLDHHSASDVGDEPVLLARQAPTAISADRPAGAELLAARGCNFIIMDDGFQNPHLQKDFSLLVIDSGRGAGNGMPIPAGPLRAPLGRQLAMANGVLVIGRQSGADAIIRQTARRGKPVYLANTVAIRPSQWKKRRVVAYAGIADPLKFYGTLKDCGADIAARRSFPDHHVFTQEEVWELNESASRLEAELVTTAKDIARLEGGSHHQRELAASSLCLEIELEFDDPRTAGIIIDATLAAHDERMLASSPS